MPSLLKATLSQQTRKQKPLRSNFHVVTITVDDEDVEIDLEDSVYVGYRRPEIVKGDKQLDDELPEYVKWRLFLARQLAMMKYKEKWA